MSSFRLWSPRQFPELILDKTLFLAMGKVLDFNKLMKILDLESIKNEEDFFAFLSSKKIFISGLDSV